MHSSPPPSQLDRSQWLDADPSYARNSLVIAAKHLSQRGLDNAAHWALDLANSTPASAIASSSSSRSWFHDKARPIPATTPARRTPSSSSSSAGISYPMQSTPFLGVVAPPSSASSLAASSPQRPPPHANATLDATPSHSHQYHADLSTSGRFPAPFRHPPSPLANLSASADADASASVQPADESVANGEDDERMSGRGNGEDDERMGDPSSSASSPRSAHVRFASEGVGGSGADELDGMDDAAYDDESIAYDLALTSFRTAQLDRCVSTLERSKQRRRTLRRAPSPRATFLRIYAAMLIVERDHDRASGSTHSSLSPLLKDLVHIPPDLSPIDTSFLLFLRGILLRKLNRRIEALDCIIRSLLLFPYNWTAWLEVHALVEPGEIEEVAGLLPKSFMCGFWREYTGRQMMAGRGQGAGGAGQDGENGGWCEVLMGMFPESAMLWSALGSTRYVQQDFTGAIEAFEYALELDPYRADGLADYSNALFLLERSEELSELAHRVSKWGSSHPEVACAMGNHFYFQSDHVRAITSFKLATTLDPGCVAAYILLGHAFIEMKNAGAASDMYRRAISINPRDYRPWHGLGKVYELLEGWSFAVHYYLRAASVAPYTGTVWSSLAHAYGKLGQKRDAVGAYARHLSCAHPDDGEAQLESISSILALLDGEETEEEQAVHWHRRAVALLLSSDEAPRVGRWAESFVRAAKAVAGLPQSFDPEASTPPPGSLENTALAHEYLARVVAEGGGRAGDAGDDTMGGGGAGERWRDEADALIKWLNGAVGGGRAVA